jgi:diaminobutyrate-2-oxoglutarate transaminase
MGVGGDEGTKIILRYIENLLDDPESGILKPAAMILEPIQGEGGVIPAPVEFLQGIRRITAERDIPLIFDEIQCGLCRSGKVFAFEYADIVPDVLILSKALGGGQPLACVLYDKKLDKWEPGAHTGTFRGNQLAMYLGKISMDMMINDNLCAHVLEVGGHFLDSLKALQKEVRCIGDIRGKGLIIGVEFVDIQAKPNHLGSLPADGSLALRVQQLCFQKKMIIERGGRHGATIRVLCSLIITKAEVDECMQVFSAAVKEAEAWKEHHKKK